MAVEQLIQHEIPPLDLVPGDKAPLGEDDGAAVRLPEGQRVAAEDVFLQDEPHRLPALVVRRLPVTMNILVAMPILPKPIKQKWADFPLLCGVC